MPTEPIRRYFHVASRARGLRRKLSIGAQVSVVASMATHMRPR